MASLAVAVVLLTLAVVFAFREEKQRFNNQRQAAGKLTFHQLRFILEKVDLVEQGQLTFVEVLQEFRKMNISITVEIDGVHVPIESLLRADERAGL